MQRAGRREQVINYTSGVSFVPSAARVRSHSSDGRAWVCTWRGEPLRPCAWRPGRSGGRGRQNSFIWTVSSVSCILCSSFFFFLSLSCFSSRSFRFHSLVFFFLLFFYFWFAVVFFFLSLLVPLFCFFFPLFWFLFSLLFIFFPSLVTSVCFGSASCAVFFSSISRSCSPFFSPCSGSCPPSSSVFYSLLCSAYHHLLYTSVSIILPTYCPAFHNLKRYIFKAISPNTLVLHRPQYRQLLSIARQIHLSLKCLSLTKLEAKCSGIKEEEDKEGKERKEAEVVLLGL